MNLLYWLLARYQQAVWNMQEVQTAIFKDRARLEEVSVKDAYADILFVWLGTVLGFGPLLVL